MYVPGLALLTFFVVLPLAVVAGVVWLVARLIRGIRRQDDEVVDEARMVQEMYQAMSRLEDRVEVLETLLLDAERRAKGGTPHA